MADDDPIQYDWWGRGPRQPPARLKTRRQLAAPGLKPQQPVGVIETRRYTLKLYDPADPHSARPKRTLGPVQRENLARGRATQGQRRAEARARQRA